MCGIFGYIGKRTDSAQLVLQGLKTLEYRGYDSWGVAEVPLHNSPSSPLILRGEIPPLRIRGGQEELRRIIIKKKAGKIGSATVDDLPPSNFAFGHTRWATHGGVTDANAHPHLDCTGSLAIVHNGIFENYLQIKNELRALGHKFISETDTEVAIHLIEEFCKAEPFVAAVRKAFNQMQGLNAIIVVNHKTRQFVAVRNGSPLVIGFGKGENFLASDALALLPYTKEVHFLEDDEMAVITDKNVSLFNVRSGTTIKPKKQILNWTIAQARKGKYPFFMLKEIHEQPAIITSIANDVSSSEKLAAIIKNSYGTYLVGCGTAAYACLAGTYLFSKIARRHINWGLASEFGYQLEFLTDKSLVIALSQSGETMDTLVAIKKAREKQAKIGALVNVLGSTLYRTADHKLLLGAGPETGVASTKAFTAKLAHLTLTAYALAGKSERGKRVLSQAADSSKSVLEETSQNQIKKLASIIKNKHHLYVIGRGLSYPASLETALKIKEISYIHAEGFAAGELKHGVIALIEKDTPCIVFAPDDETYADNINGAMELKARGGFIIGVSDKPHEVFDYYLHVEDAQEATIIPNVITAQLLAYHLTVAKALDPDKPRNLAKSVTVK